MKRPLLLFLALATLGAARATDYTRGIGRYPGRPAEVALPRLVADDALRNVALLRQATASSSIDANLTAQLATDGLSSAHDPATLRVSTPAGELDDRDREKTIDGNVVTSVQLEGERPYIQYDWLGMSVALDTLRFMARVAYRADVATRGCTFTVLASSDGHRWHAVGRTASAYLPGYRSGQVMSTDPNKRERRVALPLRKVMQAIPLAQRGRSYRHLRLVLDMPGAVAWELYEVDGGPLRYWQPTYANDNVLWGPTNGAWLPAAHFASAWVAAPAAAARAPQWLCIDLGAPAQLQRVRVDWLYRPRRGRLQTSMDGHTWADAGPLRGADHRVQGSARYVRLWLTQPGARGTYGVREVQVWGRGGLRAEPAPALTTGDGRTHLGGWMLSRAGSDVWLPATVPATVLGSYINAGAVPFNLTANNMRQASESYFCSDFIYRTTFAYRPTRSRQYLNFDGLNWKAEVTLNGHQLGRVEGAFKRARFDVTPYLAPGNNRLEVRILRNAHPGAVKLKNATSTDLNGGVLGADNPTFHATIGWDWITSTPGRNIGLWNDVYLTQDDGLTLSDPVVSTRLAALPDTVATLTPAVVVTNSTDRQQRAVLSGAVGPIRFERTIELPPMSEQLVSFRPEDYPQLRACRLALWWPAGLGAPSHHAAHFGLRVDGRELARLDFRAGLRQMDYRDAETNLTLWVNGRRLDPLGGNWGFPESNLNYRGREYAAAVAYHRDMHLNMIRNWVGQTGDDEFFDACDSLGIAVWQDFWLANPWDGPNPDSPQMFMDNARDFIRRLRRHPCLAIYVGRNEGYPPAVLDSALRRAVATLHPGLGYISSSADDGVSGHGPYSLQPEAYYFAHLSGKLHSEQGVPCVPGYESLCRMLPADSLWPMGTAWGQHDFTRQGAQQGATFVAMMDSCFGPTTSARAFARRAQWLNYNSHRAMFEAAQSCRRGLLMWMSHPCWPSMTWQTYDYYLAPTAAYFGIKKACEPLHIQLNAATRRVEVVNITPHAQQGLTATARLMRADGSLRAEHRVAVDAATDTTLSLFALPADSLTLLRLILTRGDSVLSTNFYVDAPHRAMLRPLLTAPRPELRCTWRTVQTAGRVTLTVQVANPTARPALLVRLNLKGADGEQILPAIYQDNYFALMPGEQRTLSITYAPEDGRGQTPQVEAEALGE